MIRWICILIIPSCFANAQDVVLNLNAEKLVEFSDEFKLTFPDNNNEYLMSQWSNGKLFYTNGTSKEYDSLNYNRHLNIIEVVTNNKVLTLKPMGLAGTLIYTSSTSGFVIIVAYINNTSKFLIVNNSQKYLLASYIENKEPPTENEFKVDEIRFVPKEKQESIISRHYVVFSDGNWKELKWNKSGISKLFNIDKKELQKRASKAGIELAESKGLYQIFDILNQ